MRGLRSFYWCESRTFLNFLNVFFCFPQLPNCSGEAPTSSACSFPLGPFYSNQRWPKWHVLKPRAKFPLECSPLKRRQWHPQLQRSIKRTPVASSASLAGLIDRTAIKPPKSTTTIFRMCGGERAHHPGGMNGSSPPLGPDSAAAAPSGPCNSWRRKAAAAMDRRRFIFRSFSAVSSIWFPAVVFPF